MSVRARFEPEHLGRIRLQAELTSALDKGQIFLHYQPIVDVRQGKSFPPKRWSAGVIQPAGAGSWRVYAGRRSGRADGAAGGIRPETGVQCGGRMAEPSPGRREPLAQATSQWKICVCSEDCLMESGLSRAASRLR